MREDDIVALVLLAGVGTVGYLLYTKQIEWPFGEIPNPIDIFGNNKGNDDKEEEEDEEEKVTKDIENEAPSTTVEPDDIIDYSGAQDIIDKALEAGDKFISGLTAKDFISDALKRGEEAIAKLAGSQQKRAPTPLVGEGEGEGEKSLDELIRAAYKGHPFRPPVGSAGRPYG